MRTRTALGPALAAVLLALGAGCGAEVSSGDDSVSRSDLESRLEASYMPDNPQDQIAAACEGGLSAQEGATQDCLIRVGSDEEADVRVTVTAVDDGDVESRNTPFVPPAKVAQTIRQGLLDQDITVNSVDCDDELLGVIGEKASCTLVTPQGQNAVEATVTDVDGLLVSFGYEVVS